MKSPNFESGHGPNLDSESDDSQHSPTGPPQIPLPPVVHGIDSVGEAASNTVGLGPPGSDEKWIGPVCSFSRATIYIW
ncbi:hypothetical protein Acr_26g0003080 [Actinidia rufa]|uniref:Uncharacterized protein n=1 Tax=Actinidia rufa TaxID=165716 RepID=A0A7J0H1Z7_9ERIC|nr:hypothetical protein Acr_20g0000450 [Actinidia rufa]GFZ17038.1 hypothetical protein Acr_26g0003080 [Actinidia rufa]